MKTKLIHIFVAILALVTPGVARADDAATSKKLIGYWKDPDFTFHYKPDGTVDFLPGQDSSQKWYVRNGILYQGRNSYKILTLTDSKLVIKDEGHNQGTLQMTRITAAEAK